ncbi:MAG: flagellar assembly protein FliW [Gammaproteobacteria bacterium]|nr:flagellar assembly protein FliW [Gammaproteobacteria bacterium]
MTGIARARASFLLIVTIRANETGEGIGMSVNLRAPIVLDSEQRIARQHVLSNGDYPVRQDLRAV